MSKKYVRGSKTAAIIELARRSCGVSGNEIVEATGWPAGSAKWRVEHLGASYGLYPSRVERSDGTIAYKLTAKEPVKAKPAKKSAAKVAANSNHKKAAERKAA